MELGHLFSPGEPAKFTGEGGWDSQIAAATPYFDPDRVYTVTTVDDRGFISYLTFDGVEGSFNSVMFELAE